VVQSARKPRCIACGNCVVACPFGVPEVYEERKLMMKCDMCYDRTSIGKKPMCATVCPSQALFYGTPRDRPAAPLSMPDQPVSIRSQVNHDPRVRDGAARTVYAGRRVRHTAPAA
jgi:Fe-S-cluster-containing dehydrogenase component